MTPKSVILIGMPGAGKSTIGVMLAKELAKDFIDTDVLIQVREGKTLQEIMDESDYLNLRRIEEEVLLETDLPNHVIATGGSVVYGDAGMQHMKRYGPVVFLNVSLAELTRRIHNYESRGIARRPDQSFQEVFDERNKLYRHYADIVVDCDGRDQAQVIGAVMQALDAA
ncbi:shikimate kinase [Simiduia agarivorans]|uniref:Shikimate kinase n=1 Tax=Simiduia agarivorans (strain DSM 21679 / JCM 13881 / BCRC 17597 / SA1) TaxID=1117647 RepID=K4KP99_SIMAS|nr:shikimate kinase [Simiduia agarivorans]AFV00852.1 shikimate kinase [Simiduia agarivorans SA1 = DSM 21679]